MAIHMLRCTFEAEKDRYSTDGIATLNRLDCLHLETPKSRDLSRTKQNYLKRRFSISPARVKVSRLCLMSGRGLFTPLFGFGVSAFCTDYLVWRIRPTALYVE